MDKAALIGGPDDQQDEHVVTLRAGDVRVIGLSRDQVLSMRQSCRDEQDEVIYDEFESHIVASGLLDPVLTVKEAKLWRLRPGQANEFGQVFDAIATLSGLVEGSAKAAFPDAD